MSYSDHIFTVYDLMEKKGIFRTNAANRDSVDPNSRQSLYKGPVQYPKMLYHPKGLERIVRQSEMVRQPDGSVVKVGEQRELINKLVENKKEETVLLALGWHDHPAKADKAAGRKAAPISSKESKAALEAQIEDLMRRLDDAKSTEEAQEALDEMGEADAALAEVANVEENDDAARYS